MHVRSAALFIMAFIASAGCTTSRTDAATATQKPQPPVHIVVAPVDAGAVQKGLKPGDVIDLNIEALSHMDADEMVLTVELPESLALVGGAAKMSGVVKKGDKKSLPISVKVLHAGEGEIVVQISLFSGGRSVFSFTTSYTLASDNQKRPDTVHPPKKDRNGAPVSEIRLP